MQKRIGQSFAIVAFLGLWLGAAAHTFTDMAGTYIKTGRIQRFRDYFLSSPSTAARRAANGVRHVAIMRHCYEIL
jgi:hypothetical protein